MTRLRTNCKNSNIGKEKVSHSIDPVRLQIASISIGSKVITGSLLLNRFVWFASVTKDVVVKASNRQVYALFV